MDEVITAADASINGSKSSIIPYNLPLLSAFLSCALAQFLKLFTTWYKEKRWDSRRMLSSGGMPSSHSSTVTALAVAIGFQDGTGGSTFAIAVVLACVVMYDATGVRLHAGRQAERCMCKLAIPLPARQRVCFTAACIIAWISYLSRAIIVSYMCSLLNQIVCELPPEHPVSSVRPLRDSLGHTPLQVLAGAVLGCIVAYLMSSS
ncbi:hypothetical protein ABKV19_004730 [Rosa sericea]